MGQTSVTANAEPEKALKEDRLEDDSLVRSENNGDITDIDAFRSDEKSGQEAHDKPAETQESDQGVADPQALSAEAWAEQFETTEGVETPTTAQQGDFGDERNSYREIKQRLVDEYKGDSSEQNNAEEESAPSLAQLQAESELLGQLQDGEAISVDAGAGDSVVEANDGREYTGTDSDYASEERRLAEQDDQRLGDREYHSYDNIAGAPSGGEDGPEAEMDIGSGVATARVEYEEAEVETVLENPTNPHTTNKKDIIAGLREADNGLETDEAIEEAARRKLAANNFEIGDGKAYLRPNGTPLRSFDREVREVEDDINIEMTAGGNVNHDGVMTGEVRQQVTETVRQPSRVEYHGNDQLEASNRAVGYAGTMPQLSEREATEQLAQSATDPQRAIKTVTDEYDVDNGTAKKALAFAATLSDSIEQQKATARAVAATEQASFDERIMTLGEIKDSAGGDNLDDPTLFDPKNPNRKFSNDNDYWREGKTRGNIGGKIAYIGETSGRDDAETYAYVYPPGKEHLYNSDDPSRFTQQVKVTFYDNAETILQASKGDTLAVEDTKIEWRWTDGQGSQDGYEAVATVKADTADVTTYSQFSNDETQQTGSRNQAHDYTLASISNGETPGQTDKADLNPDLQPDRTGDPRSVSDDQQPAVTTRLGKTSDTPDDVINQARREAAHDGDTHLWIDSTGEVRSLRDERRD